MKSRLVITHFNSFAEFLTSCIFPRSTDEYLIHSIDGCSENEEQNHQQLKVPKQNDLSLSLGFVSKFHVLSAENCSNCYLDTLVFSLPNLTGQIVMKSFGF